MKFSTIFSAMTILVSGTSAAPSKGGHDWSPRGGWGSSVDYSKVDWNKVDFSNADFWQHADYSKVNWNAVDWTGVNFKQVNWGRVNYPKKGLAQWQSARGIFSSTYKVLATPGQVVSGTAPGPFTPTGGLPGAKGIFQYGIIASANTICYNIVISGFQGDYFSLANTATHIHEAVKGANGPPRIVFPDPVLVDASKPLGKRSSVGCVIGPFTTGIDDTVTGLDTGFGFQVSEIEANPKGFFTDVHSTLAVPGAVRGQLS